MKNLDNHRKEICILIKSERTTGGFTQYRLKNIFTHMAMRIFVSTWPLTRPDPQEAGWMQLPPVTCGQPRRRGPTVVKEAVLGDPLQTGPTIVIWNFWRSFHTTKYSAQAAEAQSIYSEAMAWRRRWRRYADAQRRIPKWQCLSSVEASSGYSVNLIFRLYSVQ